MTDAITIYKYKNDYKATDIAYPALPLFPVQWKKKNSLPHLVPNDFTSNRRNTTRLCSLHYTMITCIQL